MTYNYTIYIDLRCFKSALGKLRCLAVTHQQLCSFLLARRCLKKKAPERFHLLTILLRHDNDHVWGAPHDLSRFLAVSSPFKVVS